jgi:hypothetical protein
MCLDRWTLLALLNPALWPTGSAPGAMKKSDTAINVTPNIPNAFLVLANCDFPIFSFFI